MLSNAFGGVKGFYRKAVCRRLSALFPLRFPASVILALCLLLSACGSSSAHRDLENAGNDGSIYSFTDSVGNIVEVPQNPSRTAVLFSSFADIWTTAGGSVEITVGEAVERGYAKDTVLLVDDGAGKSINAEALIAAEPDFVICSADVPAQAETAALLKSVGIPCAQFRVESFEDYLEVLKICTDITDDPAAYREYGADVKERIDALLRGMSGQETQKKILFIRSGSGASSAKAKTAKEHFAAAMLEEMGAYNIADNVPVLLDGLSIEEIIRENPDYIFISTMGNEKAAREYMDGVLGSPAWQALDAVREGRCFYLPKDLFQFKPNARWDEAYRYLADLLSDGG